VIHVSGEQSPNVLFARSHIEAGRPGPPPLVSPGILSYADFQTRQANWPADKVRTRLLGLFPDDADERLFPDEWLDVAQRLGAEVRSLFAADERTRGVDEEPPDDPMRIRLASHLKRFDRPYALGVDVAAGGADQTVWVVLGRFGVRQIVAKHTPDTSEITRVTRRLAHRWRITRRAVAFDAGGGGKQIADALRARYGWDPSIVDFGARPRRPDEYLNRRAELYGELRKALEPNRRLRRLLELPRDRWTRKLRCVSLPPDDGRLREELAVLPKRYDGEGKLRLPSKSRSRARDGDRGERTIRELLGGRSPDRADALALAYHAWDDDRERRALSTIRGPLIY